MMNSIKTVLVTGASRGIGLSIAKSFISKGFRVIGICRTVNDKILDDWTSVGADIADLFSLDISDRDKTSAFFNAQFFERNPIEILINNAGVTADSLFHKMSYEQWAMVIDTNLKSVFNITQPIYRYMMERKSGRIINISSVNGQRGQAGQTNYSASKAGLHGFTMALAQEACRYNITVNTVAPGYTDTAMVASIRADVQNSIRETIPLKRFATPEEISAAVIFLASQETSYVTGALIPVNGGLFIS